jgi:outer membrane protein assembly factor BamB
MNRLEARIVIVLLLAGGFVLSGCGGGSAKSSSTTKHSVPRDLYIINAKTGAIDQDFPDVNFDEGAVFPAISDGSGGWYIGGNFSRVGKVKRNGLARLRSDGSLDEEFAPRLPGNAIVTAIVRHENTVFAGGVLSGKLVSGVAAFDATSGRKLWQVTAGEIGGVNSLAFADGVLFVGGAYKKIAGVRRSGLAALDPRTGKPTSWHVRLADGRGAEDFVEAMSIENGVIYYSGGFKGTETYRENKALGAISIRTGKPTSWNPERTADLSEATAILATHGQVLVGGKGFAVFDARTGRIVPWSRHVKNSANAFAVSGNTVYLSATSYGSYGILTRVGGKRVHNLAAVILPSGKVTNWRPMPSPIPYVTALAVSGQNVLVG